MTLTEKFVNYGGNLVRDSLVYLRRDYFNGLEALKDFTLLLYNYSGRFNFEFYDSLNLSNPLCIVRINECNAVFISGKRVDEFVMSHPWDVGSRLESVLRGRLNIIVLEEVIK